MAVIPSFCGDGMAIALHTAFVATGSDRTNRLIQARKELQGQIRLAQCIDAIMSRDLTAKWTLRLVQRMPFYCPLS